MRFGLDLLSRGKMYRILMPNSAFSKEFYVCLSNLVFFLCRFEFVIAQFPAACIQNVTLPDATCCPIPPRFQEPCGGPGRGRCSLVIRNEDLSRVPEAHLNDDRFDWPNRFFRFACQCEGNFAGYMCQECWFAFTGSDCIVPVKRVRKNVMSLTSGEKETLVNLLDKLRYTPSDYMVMNTSHSADPATDAQFVNVSVFEYLTYMHYYVSRKTIFPNASHCDRPKMWPDFAHGGPAFAPWHRLYTLHWERALQKVADAISFSLPYWNWIDRNSTCDVCTDDLFGSRNWSDPTGTIDSTSVISKWRVVCKRSASGCPTCDPYVDQGPIIRRPGENWKYQTLPTLAEVEFPMSLSIYDLDPYSTQSPSSTFRNSFEGFSDRNGPSIGKSVVHNKIHSFMYGTLTDLQTAAIDPVFLVHHAMVDRLFEIWLRKTKATSKQLPFTGAEPGHHRNSFLVPFFPVEESSLYFETSKNLGYDYDDLVKEEADIDSNDNFGLLTPSWIAAIMEGGIILLLSTALLITCTRSKGTNSNKEGDGDRNTDERIPILENVSSTRNIMYNTY